MGLHAEGNAMDGCGLCRGAQHVVSIILSACLVERCLALAHVADIVGSTALVTN